MRIGMMADRYKPYISGVTNHISVIKQTLTSEYDDKVFVFTLGDEEHEDDELYVIRSPAIPIHESGFSVSFRHKRAARRKLTTMDMVHVHHPFVSGRMALRYCRPAGVPLVYTNHTRYDLYAQEYLPMVPEVLSEGFLRTYMPSFCSHCDLVIAPSPGIARVMRDLGVENSIEIIPNGVDLRQFKHASAHIRRADLNLSDEDCVLIYVGRLTSEKNITFLLRAFAGAQSVVDNLKLVIVGKGQEMDNHKDWCQRAGVMAHVRFTGQVPYEDVPAYLSLADVFVTASKSEVHPLSLIEAMATGLSGLGIRSPGIEDIIEDGVNGYLCRDDVADFSAKLTRLGLDAPLRNQFRKAARQAADKYDVSHTTRQLRQKYLEVVSRREYPSMVRGLSQRVRELFK